MPVIFIAEPDYFVQKEYYETKKNIGAETFWSGRIFTHQVAKTGDCIQYPPSTLVHSISIIYPTASLASAKLLQLEMILNFFFLNEATKEEKETTERI